MIKNKTGVWGEVYAARYLRDNGYKILTANYVCRFGELDVVAEKGGVVSVVEVKTRNLTADVSPMEAVDAGKQERLKSATKHLMAALKIKSEMRFDVCEILVDDSDKLHSINYIENAF